MRQSRYAAGCPGGAEGARPAEEPAPHPGPHHRGELLVRILLAAVAAALLASCSAVQLAYENADLYLRWRLGSYLDVEGAQAEELDERIQSFMAWHRTEALPRYADLAEEAARRVSRGIARQDVIWGYDSAVQQVREGLHAGGAALAPLLDRLTPAQLQHMHWGIAEDNRRFARENLRGSERERREVRAQRVVERLEDWVGRLSKVQVERVRQFSERAPLVAEMRDRDRRRLQADVMRILHDREARKRLPERLSEWQAGREPALAAANVAFQEEVVSLALDLDRTLTPDQRSRAAGQLRRYAHEMRKLASRAQRAP